MNVLDALKSHGIAPKKASASKNEWHSSCPGCGDGGKGGASDRFHVWPDQNGGAGSYWCRQCGAGGDLVQFFIDFEGKTFAEACAAAGRDTQPPARFNRPQTRKKDVFAPSQYEAPADQWQQKAQKFVDWAHRSLLADDDQLSFLEKRGISTTGIKKAMLGYNPGNDDKDLFRPRKSWGLPEEVKDNGKPKMLWIPRGIVVPHLIADKVLRIRIRRPDRFMRPGEKNRYYVLPGSSGHRMVIGEKCRAYIIMETELDGIMVHEKLAPLGIGVIALGTSHAKPDADAMKNLEHTDVILDALDYDKAGAAAGKWWREHFGIKVRRWPVPKEKDPGDAFKKGIDIVAWAIAGLPPAWTFGATVLDGEVGGASPQEPVNPHQPAREHPAGVLELANLLERSPVAVKIESGRKRIIENQKWAARNADASKRISQLVFFDNDVVAFIENHPHANINGTNILED